MLHRYTVNIRTKGRLLNLYERDHRTLLKVNSTEKRAGRQIYYCVLWQESLSRFPLTTEVYEFPRVPVNNIPSRRVGQGVEGRQCYCVML